MLSILNESLLETQVSLSSENHPNKSTSHTVNINAISPQVPEFIGMN